MAQLFKRSVKLVVGSLLITGLRAQFKVKKSVSKEPNDCELTIWNLSVDQRAALQSKGTRILVEAGYEGDTALIFSGDSRYIDHSHEGPDWLTKIQCGDGERAYRYAKISESFKPGTGVSDVFQRVAGALGLDVSDAVATVKSAVAEQYTQGYTAHGKASTEVDRILRGRGLEWSIQDGRLQVLREGQPDRRTAIVLSAETGLIGSPAYGSPDHGEKQGEQLSQQKKTKEQILKAKCLLQPQLRPGCLVKLDSRSVKGTFRAQTVHHTGDTHGAEFYTEVELKPAL